MSEISDKKVFVTREHIIPDAIAHLKQFFDVAVWEERFPAVAHGRQLGAMAAFELLNSDGKPDPQMTAALCAKAREKGLILLSCGFYGNSIRILVPLTVSSAVLEEGLSIIEESLEALS